MVDIDVHPEHVQGLSLGRHGTSMFRAARLWFVARLGDVDVDFARQQVAFLQSILLVHSSLLCWGCCSIPLC